MKSPKNNYPSSCKSPHEMGSPQDTCRRKIQNAKILFGAINFRSTFGGLGHVVLKDWEHPT
jgi:hypothetical protein